MSKLSVYLAGPISITTYRQATSWYDLAREMIDPVITLYRPMRGKEFLERMADQKIGHRAHEHVLATRQAILARDHDDIKRCDVVLMNLLNANEEKSIGCMMEAGFAHAYRKILVLVAQEGNVHAGHVMLEAAASYRTTNLPEACAVINALLPGDGW